jgi:hypothetical protein
MRTGIRASERFERKSQSIRHLAAIPGSAASRSSAATVATRTTVIEVIHVNRTRYPPIAASSQHIKYLSAKVKVPASPLVKERRRNRSSGGLTLSVSRCERSPVSFWQTRVAYLTTGDARALSRRSDWLLACLLSPIWRFNPAPVHPHLRPSRSSERPAASRDHWAMGRPFGQVGTGVHVSGPVSVRFEVHFCGHRADPEADEKRVQGRLGRVPQQVPVHEVAVAAALVVGALAYDA